MQKKREVSPDGSPDKNVFDIQQGVSISFFVKTKNKADTGVYHSHVYGSRQAKFSQLAELNINTPAFTKINPTAPFYLFTPQNDTLKAEYNQGTSLRDVFIESNVGLVTGHDGDVISFSKEDLELKIKKNFTYFNKDCLTTVSYRPFDNRIIYYDTKTKNVIVRPRLKLMKHMLNKDNLGLVFVRNQQGSINYDNIFISKQIIDLHLLPIGSVLAPLYLYQPYTNGNTGNIEEEKTVNFKSEFATMVAQRFNNPTPEAVLGYIYAVLHHPSYRTKYLEFLKIDFPRINFNVDINTFNSLSTLGTQLINAHTMANIPNLNLGNPQAPEGEQPDFICSERNYVESTQQLYFNKTCYFANVPKQVFNFKIGGYQVLDKYLKSHKNMDITDKLQHVQNVINILQHTINLMAEINKISI